MLVYQKELNVECQNFVPLNNLSPLKSKKKKG